MEVFGECLLRNLKEGTRKASERCNDSSLKHEELYVRSKYLQVAVCDSDCVQKGMVLNCFASN